MSDSSIIKIGLHNVHQVGHLRKNQYSMIESLQLGKNTVYKLKFARRSHNPLVIAYIVVVFKEKVRMIAAFSQLHHQIGKCSLADFSRVVCKLQSCFTRNVLVNEFLPG